MSHEGQKREYKIGTCSDCGGEMKLHPRARKNQKYCGVCRLGRNAGWHDGREATCGCGRKYIAWNGEASSRMCGFCFIQFAPLGGRESVPGTCGHHKLGECHSDTETMVFHPNLKLCYPCLQDPEKFKTNKRSILRRYAKLTGKPMPPGV